MTRFEHVRSGVALGCLVVLSACGDGSIPIGPGYTVDGTFAAEFRGAVRGRTVGIATFAVPQGNFEMEMPDANRSRVINIFDFNIDERIGRLKVGSFAINGTAGQVRASVSVNNTDLFHGSSGSVRITRSSESLLVGTYHILFTSSDMRTLEVSGSFRAKCPIPDCGP